ncbi:hypothetical protein [Adonisia turfae]|uniref:Uncharacterized protein n=1 Tax=Adonisia turfae CCMR0081 TaxID=2292702 RepID=A0A6M0RDA5_9CYAN|nr:hypothetical protein [Adonisia turfae]NEZ54215.1 hypothetical protein [Adonisia turfae CCMR0081]
MMKVLIDSELGLEFFLYPADNVGIGSIHSLLQPGNFSQVERCVSDVFLRNIRFLGAKLNDNTDGAELVTQAHTIFDRVIQVTSDCIHQAIASDYQSFEGAIESFCAQKDGIDIIISNSPSKYINFDGPILTIQQFAAHYFEELYQLPNSQENYLDSVVSLTQPQAEKSFIPFSSCTLVVPAGIHPNTYYKYLQQGEMDEYWNWRN